MRPCSRITASLLVFALSACGGGGKDGGDPGGGGGPALCPAGPEKTGSATSYDASGVGACGWDPAPALAVAVSPAVFAASAACGTCLEITGPLGKATAVVVDSCPSCADAALDLGAATFARVADPAAGRVDVTWRTVPCPVDGPIRYRLSPASNAWWFGIVPMDHRHPIAALEARGAGDATFRTLERSGTNLFVGAGVQIAGPLAIRATDVHGHVLVDENVPFAPPLDPAAQLVSGAANFPETCP
ncbi:expansin EXLX1 family cellulose-binding protein [Anaeromyxobacter sp. SG64]|uniref:expansin EXLX1 family cellulose-binding protein n=1 Tax=Anaeromyxobacter sp. SG64 TaxID=2925409 RepID=UPI001F56C605|nr:expansin EXLX1 family cellulose-binding protein [Anaeromyxobacter sp. SG64]